MGNIIERKMHLPVTVICFELEVYNLNYGYYAVTAGIWGIVICYHRWHCSGFSGNVDRKSRESQL